MKMSAILALLNLSIIFTSACGSKVNSTVIKEYRVALASQDQSFKPLIKALVDDYNTKVGFSAMEFVDSVDQSNSRILVVEGLENRDGKVGWGQWLSDTESKGLDAPGSTIDKTTRYSFQAEFDADFFRDNSKISNGLLPTEILKLFAHEVGHGFQLDHHPDKRNVMYYDITGDKDFSTYWRSIHAYFR